MVGVILGIISICLGLISVFTFWWIALIGFVLALIGCCCRDTTPSNAGQIVCLLSVGGNFMIVFMTVCMFLIMAGGY